MDMLSIEPRQRAVEKGVMFKFVKSRLIFGGPLRNIIPESLSLTTIPKKCRWGTSAKRTRVCFIFAYLKTDVV